MYTTTWVKYKNLTHVVVSSQSSWESRTISIAKNEPSTPVQRLPSMYSLDTGTLGIFPGAIFPKASRGELGGKYRVAQLLTPWGIGSCGGLTIYCYCITDGRKNICSVSLRVSFWLNMKLRSIFLSNLNTRTRRQSSELSFTAQKPPV